MYDDLNRMLPPTGDELFQAIQEAVRYSWLLRKVYAEGLAWWAVFRAWLDAQPATQRNPRQKNRRRKTRQGRRRRRGK